MAESDTALRFTHQVRLRHRAGPVELDVEFRIDHPWTALFAPSGAGKSTILRLIAGLDRPSGAGFVRSVLSDESPEGEHLLLAADGRRTVFVPPHLRQISMVAQQPALFPGMSAGRNIGYALKVGQRAAEADPADTLQIRHLLDKMPDQLSGGEQQRIAVARALSREARLVLLDEPFTGLDASLRLAVIDFVRQRLQQRGVPVLLVTHDVAEVFATGAYVLKLEGGRIVAQGSAADVLAGERTQLLQQLQA